MSQNDENILSVEQQAGTLSLILNRPAVCNALNPELIEQLITKLNGISNDETVRVVIISGSGDHFCAGADINWMQQSIEYTAEQNTHDASRLAVLMRKLNELNKPTICIVQGSVYGGAMGLVACCDISIAVNNAVFCSSEVKIGLAPAVISPYVLNAIGSRAARRWLLTGEKFDCYTAEHLGLVHNIVNNAGELDHVLTHYVKLFDQAGPNAIAATKQLLIDESNNKDLALSQMIAELRVSTEGQEGLRAFLEKRKPNWQTID